MERCNLEQIWSDNRDTEMKKVLIVANLFHSSPRIPGAATYLPEFRWNATIITPPLGKNAVSKLGFPKTFLEKTRIVEVPYKGDVFQFWRKLFKRFGYKTDASITEQMKERLGLTAKKSFVDIMIKLAHLFLAYPDTERTWKKPALKSAKQLFLN
jgi:hypothetical protein